MRRLIDIAIACTAVALLSPLLVVIALAIMTASRASPLYGGRRVGRLGKEFRMWKFRTMVVGADRSGSITGKRDARVTPLGRLLRKTKLDELPQLFNLLRGEMTIVGPRPEAPDMVALYSTQQRLVLKVKPGVTGISQISTADESETIPEGVDATQHYVEHILDRKVAADLAYIARRNAWSDARIVLATCGLLWKALAGLVSGGRRGVGSAIRAEKII